MGKFMRDKNIINKGFSLIELIVTIAIITTLAGLIVPQFVSYITNKKTMGCEENRKAILNIYEKCVYGTGTTETLSAADITAGKQSILGVNDADFKLLVSASTGSEDEYNNLVIPDEYKEEIKRHFSCPDGGTITVEVIDGVAYCECSCTEHDTCVTDMTGWEGVESEGLDPGFDIPTVAVTPSPTPSATPTTTPTPSPTPAISDTYWPYGDSPQWDSATDGRNPGSVVKIKVPSGKFASRTTNGMPIYFVAVDRNNSKFLEIKFEHCKDPSLLLKGTGGTEDIIQCSGMEYDSDTIWTVVDPTTGNKETKKANKGQTAKFMVGYGDIYSPDGGKTRYIYGTAEGTDPGGVELPKKNSGNKFGNWYLMGPDEVK